VLLLDDLEQHEEPELLRVLHPDELDPALLIPHVGEGELPIDAGAGLADHPPSDPDLPVAELFPGDEPPLNRLEADVVRHDVL
jgi:hypothetical protein